jgi:hypothetical protein
MALDTCSHVLPNMKGEAVSALEHPIQHRPHPIGQFFSVTDQVPHELGVGLGKSALGVPHLGQSRARVALHTGQEQLAEAISAWYDLVDLARRY